MNRSLKQSLRMLLLPMQRRQESECGEALKQYLEGKNVAAPDFASWIRLELAHWSEHGTPAQTLRDAVTATLIPSHRRFGQTLGSIYFGVHRQLIEQFGWTHGQATAFLGHSYLMLHLAKSERLSAAQISKVLAGRDRRVEFSRQSVLLLLAPAGAAPALSKERVAAIVGKDAAREVPYFADADNDTAAQLVEALAQQLGCRTSISGPLITLSPADHPQAFVPYLQMLHFQCVLAEDFDHALTDIYEFAPRGAAADTLFQKYEAIAQAQNPFLNNAKSVERLDAAWVRTKKTGSRPGARALATLLEGLEEMGFHARRELAGVLRLWLHRKIRQLTETRTPLPDRLTPAQIRAVFARISAGNTGTYGILEQRSIDTIARRLHAGGQGWRARGLSDSVHATNVSRRKFGDCDFQNSAARQIVAYESHGGALTETYLREHVRTLGKAIQLRKDELTRIADLDDWNVQIVFVAHGVEARPPAGKIIEGLRVSFEALTFAQFFQREHAADTPDEDFHAQYLHVLENQRTPDRVRRRFLEIIR